jgi:FlaA1/EpsC-like NDP-sugar epimerase
MVAVADVLGLLTAFALAGLITAPGSPEAGLGWTELVLFVVMLPVWIGLAELQGLYRRDEERTGYSTLDDLFGVLQLVTLGSWLYLIAAWVTELAAPSVPSLLVLWALAFVLVTLARGAARAISRRQVTLLQNTIIVGAGSVAQLIAEKFLEHRRYGVNLVGLVDASPRERRADLVQLPLLGPPEDLRNIVQRYGIERAVFAFSADSSDKMVALVRSLEDLDVQIDVVPRLFELVGPGARIHAVDGIPLIRLSPLRMFSNSHRES